MGSELKVKQIAPWFGSQAAVNDQIIPLLGDPDWFYDLACGGCSLLLAKKRSRVEVLNDLHPGLVNVLRVLNGPRAGGVQKLLQGLIPCETLFNDAVAYRAEHGYPVAPGSFQADSKHVEAAFYQFVEWWLGQGGMAGTKDADERPRMSKRYTEGGRSSTRLLAATASVEAFRARLRGVDIWHSDMMRVLPKIKDLDGTTIFIDPTWIDEGHQYRHALDATEHREPNLLDPGGRDPDDFDTLSRRCSRFEHAQVVIRLGRHERLVDLFPRDKGWKHHPITKNNNISNQSGNEGVTKDEVLLVKNATGDTA